VLLSSPYFLPDRLVREIIFAYALLLCFQGIPSFPPFPWVLVLSVFVLVMVILRNLSGEEGESPSIPPLGSALERQIRSHCTRDDGSLDEDRYLTEMLGLPLIESDSSSTSSDSDSDCVIIPRSSFTGKELVLFDASTATMFAKSKFNLQIVFRLLGGPSNYLVLGGNAMSL
jgi:hypothetical protein